VCCTRRGAVAFLIYFRTYPLERKIMSAHTGEEELKRIYHDVLAEGRRLGVRMPHFAALEPYVDTFQQPTPVGATRA
jgi:2-dehydropantoate 2-reductase